MKKFALIFLSSLIVLIGVSLLYAHAQIRSLEKLIPAPKELFAALYLPQENLPNSLEYIVNQKI